MWALYLCLSHEYFHAPEVSGLKPVIATSSQGSGVLIASGITL
jgi:hypothetical protein